MYYYSETSVLGFLGFQNPCKNALNREFKWIFWHDFRIVTIDDFGILKRFCGCCKTI
jgi:hypothetical protein